MKTRYIVLLTLLFLSYSSWGQDTVSVSYVLPADKIATVKVGSTTVVEMHNELRDTPKTGDNSNVGLWTALAGLSALGIVGTAVVAYRKKKKEDNE